MSADDCNPASKVQLIIGLFNINLKGFSGNLSD
jgi:hypothetical protein